MVVSPDVSTLTPVSATSSTSRSVAVTLNLLSVATNKILLKIGIVCRRSTTPIIDWSGFKIVSRDALSFIL
jgi:hypothetical protein